jgi:tetratricopeptide (TPR) repeat protein
MASPCAHAQIIGVDEVPAPVILTAPLPSGAVGLPVPPPLSANPQGFGVYTGAVPTPVQPPVQTAPPPVTFAPPVATPSSSSANALQPQPEPASLDRLRQTVDSLELQVKALREMLVRGTSRELQAGLSSINAFLRGRQFAERRLYRAAIDAFNDAILLDPGNDSAFLLRAESYQQLTDLSSAEADFNESLRLQPNNSRAYLGRANVRAAQGKLPEALADVAEAVTRDPQNTQGYLTRARLRDLSNDLNSAIADYSKAFALAPSTEALLGRATAYLRSGQFALAAEDCSAASRINPNAPLAHLCLAEVHIRQNSIGDAVASLNKAVAAAQFTNLPLPVLPQLPTILAQSAAPTPDPAAPVLPPAVLPQVLASLRPEPAATQPAKAPEPKLESAPAPAPKLTVVKAEPAPKPAAPKVAVAKPQAPQISAAEYNRQARDLINQGHYEEALDLLNQAVARSPKYAQAFNARGFVHLLMLNYTSAVADFTEAIRLKPDYANAYHNRSVALRKLSKTSDAEADEKNASRYMAVVYQLQ